MLGRPEHHAHSVLCGKYLEFVLYSLSCVSRESLHSCVANNLSHLPHGGSYFRNLTFLLNLYLSIVYDFVSVSTLFAYCEF